MRVLSLPASVLVIALVGTIGSAALAAPPPPPGDTERNTREAERLYNEGKKKYEIAEYDAALDLWKRAYGILPDTDEARRIRHSLVYNISEAEIKAYEVKRDPTHLRKAKMLMESYLSEHRALYGDESSATKERAEVRSRLDDVEVMIKASENAGEKPPAGSDLSGEPKPGPVITPQPAITPEVRPLSPEKQRRLEIKTNPELAEAYSRSKKKVVGGAVMLGIGAALGLVTWGAATVWANADPTPDSNDILAPNRRNWGITALVFGIPAAGLLAGGAAMLAIGLKERRAILSGSTVVVPYVGPGQAGLSLSTRF